MAGYALRSKFELGYRNKEDISTLPPETLVVGSQNVLTNAAEQVGIRQGYVLDGVAGNQNNYGIDSSYDFESQSGVKNLRKWGPNLEVRYLNPVTNIVSWISLLNALVAGNKLRCTSFWDYNTEKKEQCIMVNGDTNLYEWSGGVGSFLSASNATGIVASLNATTPIVAGGQGYQVGDILTLAGGTGATVMVTSINPVGPPDGVVTGVQLITNGTGYSAGTVATTGVNGTGCTIAISAVGNNSITVSGMQTLSQLGFYDNAANSSEFILIINGTKYTYAATNASLGTTFVGFSIDPTTQGFTIGDAIIQAVVTQTQPSNLPTGFSFDLISTVKNQVYYGDVGNNTIYISKVNNYLDVTFSSPRLPGEGALATLDSAPIGFKPQSTQGATDPSVMYIAAGNNQWYALTFVLSSDLTNESLQIQRLKTTALQGAQSQELISDFKNTIAFVSNEPQLNEFGIQADYFAEPQMVNISDPIKYDMDAYDFTNGAVDYDNFFLYILIPVNSVVRMYNIAKKYWEAPQVLPISRFYRVNGELYGHSSLTNESYQMFTGYSDNGNPINAVAAFPYVAEVPKIGEPDDLKSFDRIYTEGYIAGNTKLTLTINYDFGGFSGTYNVVISGQPVLQGGKPNPIIFNKVTDGSIGQNSLGSQPVGTILNLPTAPPNPKFRVINTMPKHDFYESQIVYSSNEVDQQWTLLRFGPLVQPSINKPTAITL